MHRTFSALTPRVGLEPTTTRLTAECSTIELSRNMKYVPSELHTEHLMSLATFDSIITSPSLLTFHHLLLPLLNPLRISPRPISTCQLHALPHLHSKPIYLVVFKGSYSCDGISYLEGGFTLRCLQRLSLPDLATLPCTW